LHEQGFNTDVIELQLAHAEGNSVKAAYNHARHLPESLVIENILNILRREK